MKHSILCILPLALSLLFTSCIRDDLQQCPPLTVNVAVKDFNYSNAALMENEPLKPDNAPLSAYVKTLAWHVVDVATGRTVAEQQAVASPDDKAQTCITLPADLPFGRYAVAVWGGLESETPSPELLPLEDADDPYLVNDTLLYDAYHYDYTLRLKRIKSKLNIEVTGLPAQYKASASSKKESGLFAEVDDEFQYDGECEMGNRTIFAHKDEVQTQTILPPSTERNATRVSIEIYDDQGKPVSQLKPTEVVTTLYRNTITALRYVYSEEKQGYDIYVRINDEWEAVHPMDIE